MGRTRSDKHSDSLERHGARAIPVGNGRGLSIGEVAREAGVRASALRYYEAAGVLPAPRRAGGRRVYDAAVVDHLAFVRLAQQAGFTVAEIQTLVSGFRPETPPSARWRALASRKLDEIDALIARAQTMRATLEAALGCECLTLDECGRMAARCAGGPEHGTTPPVRPASPQAPGPAARRADQRG